MKRQDRLVIIIEQVSLEGGSERLEEEELQRSGVLRLIRLFQTDEPGKNTIFHQMPYTEQLQYK